MLALVVAAAVASQPSDTAMPIDLRVERLAQRDALGVDTGSPLLSWAWSVPSTAGAGSASRGAAMPAVELTVALTTAARDAEAEADAAGLLWRQSVPAGGTSALRYDGQALASTTRVHWRVCPSSSGPAPSRNGCATASFVTGQLSPTDWSAEWIGGRQLRSPTIALPAAAAIHSAVLTITGLGFYECWLNGNRVSSILKDVDILLEMC